MSEWLPYHSLILENHLLIHQLKRLWVFFCLFLRYCLMLLACLGVCVCAHVCARVCVCVCAHITAHGPDAFIFHTCTLCLLSLSNAACYPALSAVLKFSGRLSVPDLSVLARSPDDTSVKSATGSSSSGGKSACAGSASSFGRLFSH